MIIKHIVRFNICVLLWVMCMSCSNLSCAQNIVDYNAIYIENELVYTYADNTLFTGTYQKKRRNGHLVYQEHFKNGIIQNAQVYYNGKNKIISEHIEYQPNKPYIYKSRWRYNLESQLIEKKSYNNDGQLILIEEFKNSKLTYSCQYNGKKKHGKEMCYSKKGTQLEFEYKNGKKVKN